MKNLIYLLIALIYTSTSIFSQNEVSFYSEGMEYFNRSQYSKALDDFSNYLKLDKTDEELYSSAKFYIGECYLGLEQFDGAITQYEYFIKEYPTSNFRESALYRLGNLYFDKHIYEKSRKNLIKLIKEYPNSELSGSAYHVIGESFIAENNLDKAEEFFSSAAQKSKYYNKYVDYSLFALANIYEKKNKYREAVETYDELLSFHRNSSLVPIAQMRIGVCYYELGEYDNSILELADPLINELDLDDKNDADYILANAFYKLNEFDNSSQAYKRILDNNPNEEMLNKIRYGLAWIYFQQGNYDSAYKFFNLLSDVEDDSIAVKAFYWSGEAKRYDGKFDESIEIHKKFAMKYPDHPLTERVRLNIGISKFSESNFNESEASLLESANSKDPLAKSKSLTLLGEINLRKKQYKVAQKFFKDGLAISQIPNELKDRCNLGLGVAEFYLKDNVSALKRFYTIDKSSTKIDKNKLNFYSAEANFFIGNYSDAINNYNGINSDDETITKNTTYGKAFSYFNLKDFTKSIYFFKEFIRKYNDKSPRYYESVLRLADSYYGSKDYKNAVENYRLALTSTNQFANDELSYFNYAQALFKNDKPTTAIEILDEIQVKFVASKIADDAQYLKGWIYFQQNDFAKSIESYERLVQVYPNSNLLPIAYYSIGDCYFNLGKYNSAIDSYNNLISTFPTSQYVFDAVNGIQYCYVVDDKPAKAIDYLKDFIDDNSDLSFNDKIQYKIGEIYYSNGEYDSAVNEYSRLVATYPNSSLVNNSYYWMGKSSKLGNKPNDAISYFEIVKTNSLNSEEGFNSVLEIGDIYRKENNFEKEISLYDEVLPRIKDLKQISEINFVKAQAFIQNGNIEEAYGALNEIVGQRDGSLFNFKAEIELAILEIARLKYNSALDLLNDVEKNKNDDLAAQAIYYKGVAYFEQDRIAEAITELVKVRSMYEMYDEWYSKSLMLLGDSYTKIDDKKNAAEMYKAVIKRHNRDILGKEAKQKLNSL